MSVGSYQLAESGYACYCSISRSVGNYARLKYATTVPAPRCKPRFFVVEFISPERIGVIARPSFHLLWRSPPELDVEMFNVAAK